MADRYFGGEAPGFTPPLLLTGSPFRLAVWNRLLQIPYGQTATYGEISAALGEEPGKRSRAAQAVGGRWGITPSPLSCRAIGWSAAAAV